MADFSAGDAKLAIIPDASGFKKKLEADMGRIRAEFGLNVTAQTAQARADIDRLRVQQERNSISLGVDANLAKLQAELAAFRAKQRMDPVTVPVHVDKASHAHFESNAKELAGKFAESFKSALSINMLSAGFGLIPGAVTMAAGLTQALQQLSQAALVLPGAMSAAGSSIGTLAVGLGGVKDAWSAISKEADQAGANQTASADKAKSAAQASAAASQGLVRAQRELGNAYKDTRRELENLNLSLRGGQISEQQAIINAAKARRDLAKDLAAGQVRDQLDYQSRLLDIASADQSVAEARQRNIELQQRANDANAKGIEGADRVVAAHEAVDAAQARSADAQAKAAEASKETSAAAAAAAAAMGKLAPAAQEFLRTLQELKPTFLDLRQTVQGNLFAGLSESMRNLVASDVPVLKEGLGSIATSWNGTLKALMAAAGSDSTKGLLGQLVGNTAEAQSRMNAAIEPLVHAFGVLSVAGSKTLPHLADVFDRLATRFDDFISAADKDGRLAKWIADGEHGLANLGNILLNLGKTFDAIHKALGGDGMLASLDHLTEKMATFFSSARGQGELRAFFAEGRRELELWKPILHDLPAIFRGLFSAASDATHTFLPLLQQVTHLLATNPGLIKILVGAFLTFKTVTPVIQGVQAAMGLLSTGLVNLSTGFAPMKTKAAEAMSAVDGEFAKVGKEGSGMSKFAGKLSALSGAGGLGLAALVTVGLPLVENFVTKFTQDMDDAAAATKALDDEARTLIGSLEEISNLVGSNTRGQVVQNLSNVNPGGNRQDGLSGDAIKAADELLGASGGQDVTDAALPGGDQKYGAVMGRLRDAARGRVGDYIRGQGIDMNAAKERGIDENTVLDAYLGVPGALDKIREWKDLGVNVIRLDQIAPSDQNDPAYKAGLIGGALNKERAAVPDAQARANRNQRAQYGQRTLKPGFASTFPGAEVHTGASGTAIVSTAPPSATGLEAVGPPSPDGKYTYMLSPDQLDMYTDAATPDLVTAAGHAAGGPISGPGTGTSDSIPAWLSDGEYVVNAAAAARNKPLLDRINSYAGGGMVDPNGNPLDPGLAPGPIVSPAGNAPIAPAPSTGGGLLGAFLGGLSGSLGQFANLGANMAGVSTAADPAAGTLSQQAGVTPMTQAGTPEGLLASRASTIPGLWGLVGGLMSPDPVGAGIQWAGQTADWAANAGMNILGKVGSTLWSGALGMVGLQNSILSPNNVYNQAVSSTLGFFTGGSGPIGTLLGMGGGSGIPGMGSVSGAVPAMGEIGSTDMTLGDGSTISIPTFATADGTSSLANILGGGTGGGSLLGGGGGVSSFLERARQMLAASAARSPGGVNSKGAQIDTIRAAAAVLQAFPQINDIGMWRPPDGFNEHSSGQAADVMIPGWGGPQGQSLGTAIKNYVIANGAKLGVDYVIWQQKEWHTDGRVVSMGDRGNPTQNHFDHVHVHTLGGGYPAAQPTAPGHATGGSIAGPGGPTGDKIPAMLSDGEHVLTAADVTAMGGHQNVYAFRNALHRADGGPILPFKPLPAPVPIPPPGNAVTPMGGPPPPAGVPPTPPGAPTPPPAPGQPDGAQPTPDGQPAPAGPLPPPSDGNPPPPPDQNGDQTQKPGDDITRAVEKLTEVGGAGMGAAPTNRDHTLPALSSAIQSGASNIGSWISTAVSAAAAGGSMGMGGGAGASLASPLIQGGIQQGAKLLTGGLNILSSFLVGNIPGSFGAADDATGYGQVVRAQQREPITAASPRIQNNTFHGMDVPRVFQELDLRDAQHKQAALAGYRG